MTTLAERIATALDQSSKTQAELARYVGVTEGAVTQWMSGGVKSLRATSALKISDFLGVSQQWLTTGRGPMRPASGGQPSEPGPEFAPVARVLLKVSAGVTGFRVEHMEGNGPPVFFRADWINARGYKADKLMALKVSGESMEPGLWDGDLVVINSADTQPTDGEVFVANYEGEVVIKRLERNAGEWWLTSDNPRFKPKKCDEHAELLGRVVYKQSERI